LTQREQGPRGKKNEKRVGGGQQRIAQTFPHNTCEKAAARDLPFIKIDPKVFKLGRRRVPTIDPVWEILDTMLDGA
jgi:hypothetical protein